MKYNDRLNALLNLAKEGQKDLERKIIGYDLDVGDLIKFSLTKSISYIAPKSVKAFFNAVNANSDIAQDPILNLTALEMREALVRMYNMTQREDLRMIMKRYGQVALATGERIPMVYP